MSLFQIFSKPKVKKSTFKIDLHSHLLPGIDDGVQSFEESISLIKQFEKLGFTKLITTPHIMGDYFKNEPSTILKLKDELQEKLISIGSKIEIEAAAEYYLDEWFVEKVNNNSDFLTFGEKYLLIETSYINQPNRLFETIFELLSKGYKPIIAHPERYNYVTDKDDFLAWKEKGMLLQINLNSLSGYYSQPAKKYAEFLVKNELVDFIGSDCHGQRHVDAYQKSMQTKSYQILNPSKILNDTL